MKLFLAGILVFGSVGCMNLQPVGPLVPKRPPAREKADERDPDDPVTVPAEARAAGNLDRTGAGQFGQR